MSRRSADIISVVEAAYQLDCDREAWLQAILLACRPHLDQGLGLAAFTFEVSGGRLVIGRVIESGTPEGFGKAYAGLTRQTPPAAIERAYLGAPGLQTYRNVFADSPEAIAILDEQIGPATSTTNASRSATRR